MTAPVSPIVNLPLAVSLSGSDLLLVVQNGVVKLGTVSQISAPAPVVSRRSFGIIIDGGGSAITTGVKGDLVIPNTGVIKQWTILSDQVGSIVVDVWKTTYAAAPPTVANTIAGSELPTLSAAQKNQNTSLGTWATAVTAGDVIRFNVNSAATVTRVTIAIEMDV